MLKNSPNQEVHYNNVFPFFPSSLCLHPIPSHVLYMYVTPFHLEIPLSQVELKQTKSIYAMKVIKKELVMDEEDIDWVQTEKHVFEQASNHPFLVGLHSCFQTDSRYASFPWLPGLHERVILMTLILSPAPRTA